VPSPAKTSVDEIVHAGRAILESEGLEGLTLQAVAREVGVRAPSLYKRIDGRGDLVRRIGDAIASDLGAAMKSVTTSRDPKRDLRALAHTARRFAHEQPRGYALLFAPLPEAWRVDATLNAEISALLLQTTAEIVGEADATNAARTVVAWVNGFIAMEQAGAFRLGGDIDDAFEYGVDRIIAGLEGRAAPSGKRAR
jgi:AcrR family transcriptional regulator